MTTKKLRSVRNADPVKGESPKGPVRRKSIKANSNSEPVPTDDEIARKAYELWVDRGCPMGSPDKDWFRAKDELTLKATA